MSAPRQNSTNETATLINDTQTSILALTNTSPELALELELALAVAVAVAVVPLTGAAVKPDGSEPDGVTSAGDV